MERITFKPCRGNFGYEASEDGEVIFRKKGKITYLRSVTLYKSDIKYVRIKRFGKDKYVKVAEMVALAHVPKKEGDILYCRNGDWNDYSRGNLYWDNPRQKPENCNKMWRMIKNFNQKYEVSEDGFVRQYKTCKVLAQKQISGHMYVKLYSGRKMNKENKPGSCYYSVALLVAQAFVDNPTDSDIVAHIDGNASNNYYSNLVWGKRERSTDCIRRRSGIKVDEYSLDGKYITTWDSITKASIAREANIQDIRACCIGDHITSAGSVWRWHGEAFDSHRTPQIIKLRPGEYFKRYPETNIEVSNYGTVRNIITGWVYKWHKGGVVRIKKNGKTISKKNCIMVAELFLPNPKGYKQVTFRDGNPNNTYVGNLKWVKDKG